MVFIEDGASLIKQALQSLSNTVVRVGYRRGILNNGEAVKETRVKLIPMAEKGQLRHHDEFQPKKIHFYNNIRLIL